MSTYPIAGIAEPFSSIVHLAGALSCVAYTPSLVATVPRGLPRITISIFCGACVILLVMSGLFHLLPIGSVSRDLFCRLDHAAIFVLIAGTFTPVHGILFTGFYRSVPIIGIWVLAITGIAFQILFYSQISEVLGLAVYLGVGWLGAISAALLWREHDFRFVGPIVYGCIAYTVGGLLDYFRQPVLVSGVFGAHEIFHLAVLVGIFCHWRFMHSIQHCEKVRVALGSA